MSHPLAVYTVIYVAILFVTASIWGSDIASATGDAMVLLLTLGAFSLKLAIDDYIHFQGARKKGLHVDLNLSLVIYLLLAAGIACSAVGRTRVAVVLFAFVFLTGAFWLCLSGFSGDGGGRRIAWFFVNCVAVVFLTTAWVLNPKSTYTYASIPLTLLLLLVIADFIVFGTLKRLANIEGGAPASPDPSRATRPPAEKAGTESRRLST